MTYKLNKEIISDMNSTINMETKNVLKGVWLDTRKDNIIPYNSVSA